jgi:DNA-binding PadR family transcriptional regulator
MEPLYGVLDMLVLRTLLFGPLHGYAIAKSLHDESDEAISVEFGSQWETSERNRRAKVYRLTPEGRKKLNQEKSEWAEFVRAVTRIMKPGVE